jgi:hypothetical protein
MPQIITGATRLSKALELHPDVLEYIVSLNPHDFSRLHNPLMRKLMAGRITLARVAAMTHTNTAHLLEHIAEISGATVEHTTTDVSLPQTSSERPAWLEGVSASDVRTVNLLPLDERLDADPMLNVNAAIRQLEPGAVLLIEHRWEPQPFYDVWAKMPGLAWFSERLEADRWRIWVHRHV